jgi:hypothetical protein
MLILTTISFAVAQMAGTIGKTLKEKEFGTFIGAI